MTKAFWISFVSIFSWSLCFVIAIIWSVVSFNFISGAFNERREYPQSLYFEEIQYYFDAKGQLVDINDYYKSDGSFKEFPKVYDELGNYIDFETIYDEQGKLLDEESDLVKKATVLKINGITESNSANVAVDGKIKIGSEPRPQFITKKKIQLISSNTDVATVPKYANIGEEIVVTATKNDKGINNGGYCSIIAKTEDGVITTVPIYIFVDIPVSDINLTLEGENIFEPSEEESEKGVDYVLYVDQKVVINPIFSSTNSVNPSQIGAVQNGFSFINVFKNVTESSSTNHNRFPSQLEKPVEWTNFEVLFDEKGESGALLDYQDYFHFDRATTEISTYRASTIKLSARILKTYSDMLFVDTYVPSSPGVDNTPSEAELVDRYVSDDIVILIKPITLVDMEVNTDEIELKLFDTTEVTAEQLSPKFLSSRGDYEYFKDLKNILIVTSFDNSYLTVEKITGRNAWNLTVIKESPQGISINISVTHADTYVEKQFSNLSITQVGIKSLEFNGTAKSDSESAYNDIIPMQIVKSDGQINDIQMQQNGEWRRINLIEGWNYLSACNILSMEEGVQTTYNLVKVFATGVINNMGTLDENHYNNEQGEEILNLSIQTNLGREIINTNNLQGLLPKARGNIYITAYVIKTDNQNNPIDADGNIISESDMNKNYIYCIASKTLEIRIVEKLTKVDLFINTEQEEGDDLEVLVTNNTASVVVLQTGVAPYLFEVKPNSYGALFDAISSNKLTIECFSDNELNDSVMIAEMVPGIRHSLGEGVEGNQIEDLFNLQLNVRGLSDGTNNKELNVMIKVDSSTLLTLKVVVVRVKVGEIILTSSLSPDVQAVDESNTANDDHYTLIGKLNRTEENGEEKITTTWGKEVDGDLKEFRLNKPTLYPAQIELDKGENAIYPRILKLTGTNIVATSDNEMLTIGAVENQNEFLDYKVNSINMGESNNVKISVEADGIIKSILLNFTLHNNLIYSNFNDTNVVNRNILRGSGIELLNNAFTLDIKTPADIAIAQFNATQLSKIWFTIPKEFSKVLAIEDIYDENNPDRIMSRMLRLTNQASASLDAFQLTVRYTTTDNLQINTTIDVVINE